jgi:spermidine synthase
MIRTWRCIATAASDEGELRCLARGEPARDYMITVGGRVLMVSHAARSEQALARLAREALADAGAARARVLVGGLGMGYTLRAALDAWPATATFVVCELNPVIVEWCRGPLALLSGRALDDPRVSVAVDDVAALIARALAHGAGRFDAILLDLYEGPNEGRSGEPAQRHYTDSALHAAGEALRPGGVLAIWSETRDAAFERRLAAAGLRHGRHHPDRGARRHTIYLIGGAPGRRSGG